MTIAISRDKTAILKGIAILFMILHHVLIKEFYVNPPEVLSSILSVRMQICMKMCVGIYTFIIGYGFWFCSSYGVGYVLRHIGKLLRQYWIVLIFFMIPVSYWGGYIFNVKKFVLNLFGLEPQYCLGNWYVYFYMYALLILPMLKKWLEYQGLWRLIVAIVAFVSLRLVYSENRYMDNCFMYSQMLVVGMFCAKSQVLTHFGEKVRSRCVWFVIALLAVFIRCISGIMGLTTDVVAVPIFVIAICGLSQGYEKSLLFLSLTKLGKCSTYMWFIHCLFFSDATRNVLQHLPIWSNSLLGAFVVATVVSFVLSLLLYKAETIIQKINK